MTTYRLMDGQNGRPGVGSSGTQPPSSPLSFSGNYSGGLVFEVTEGGQYFQGYWWYVPSGGDADAAIYFALWQITGTNEGTFIPASEIAWPDGSLTAGAWNFIPCAAIPLTPNIPYEAVVSYSTTIGYPQTQNQFYTGDPYANGITNGPLKAYGYGTGASSPTTGGIPQSPLMAPPAIDPGYYLPTANDLYDLLWLDVQVTDQVPSGTPERAWPNMPVPWPAATAQNTDRAIGMEFTLAGAATLQKIWHYAPYGNAGGDYSAWQQSTANTPTNAMGGSYTFGMEFEVTESCIVTQIWFYSAPGLTALPLQAAIYEYPGTTALEEMASPVWSGVAGSGWISCNLSGDTVVSPGNAYYVAVFGDTGAWWSYNTYWGPGGTGVANGPLSVPGAASSRNGQGVIYNGGSSINYPAGGWSDYNAWMDVTVTPSVVGVLPSECAIWDTAAQTIVTNTDITSPTWHNADGSTATGPGWVYCDYSTLNLVIPAGTYTASTFSGAGSEWYVSTSGLFGSGGLQAAGFSQDILSIPGGNSEQPYNTGGWGFPATASSGEADWIDVEVIPVPAASYRFMDGQDGRPGNGPTTAETNSGDMVVGLGFEPLQGGCWLEGYWYWVCPANGMQQQQKFALWQPSSGGAGTVVPNSVVTSSGNLTAGWNYVRLPTPVPLAVATQYQAATGVNGNFAMSASAGQGTGAVDGFGTGGHTKGILNGPIFAYSDETYNGGLAPSPMGQAQGGFTTGGSDPSVVFPGDGDDSANFWIDVQVTTTPPFGYSGSYRVWPNNFNASEYTSGDAAVNYIVGTEVRLSKASALNAIWYYSPSGSTQLATECAVWDTDTQTKVAENTSPNWLTPTGGTGAAGSGWVKCTFSGVELPAGRYRVAIYNGAASPESWNAKHVYYFSLGDSSSGYPGQGISNNGPTFDGIRSGPLYAPSLSAASATDYYDNTPDLGSPGPGQSVFAVGPPNSFPNIYVKGLGQSYWVDMEVTPPSGAGGSFLPFFH